MLSRLNTIYCVSLYICKNKILFNDHCLGSETEPPNHPVHWTTVVRSQT
jgi:hypothetical protein